MKDGLKKTVESLAPGFWRAWAAWRTYRKCRARYWEGQCSLAGQLYGPNPITVLGGPFRGTRYLNEVVWGPLGPRWLGTYESELHPIMEKIGVRRPDTLIDIGSAEGYYAIGLARLYPWLKIYSFEIDPRARRHQKKMAALNGVSNVTILRHCSQATLAEKLQGRSFVICDIEGGEIDLLNPAQIPPLQSSDMLVEEHSVGGLTIDDTHGILVERFAATHTIQRIFPGDRVRPDGIPLSVWESGSDEDRIEPTTWAYFEARQPDANRTH